MALPAPSFSLPERYTLGRHVANGGMAAVWTAHDEVLHRDVAVKVLSDGLAADEAARARFTREARSAARLSAHPHVVTVFDAGEHEGHAFLVMALYTGGTVADRLRQGPVAPELALGWLEDVAGALDAAHVEGVVHRDVKPANLLLDAGGRIAVGDFGIATAAWETSMTQTGLVLGTIAYLAPEQRAGAAATSASDLFALGLVARELLTSAKPGLPVDGPPLPPGVEAVIAQATDPDPARRFGSGRAFVDALRASGVDRVAGAGDEPTAMTQAIGSPRARAAAAGIGVAAGAAAATAPADALGYGGPREPRRPRTPAPQATQTRSDPTSAPGSRGRGPLLALAAVALALGLGGAFIASDGDPPSPERRATTSGAQTGGATDDTASSDAPAPTPTAAPETTQAPNEDPLALNERGRALTSSDPAAAVPLLQQAVDGLCGDGLNCAFALFNLGRALRLAGRPEEAIVVLERRLQVNGENQRATVEAELAAARQAAGQTPSEGDGNDNGKGKGKGKRDDR